MMNTLTLLACLYIQFVVAELDDGNNNPLTAATFAYTKLVVELDSDVLLEHRLKLLLAVRIGDRFLREQGLLPALPDSSGR